MRRWRGGGWWNHQDVKLHQMDKNVLVKSRDFSGQTSKRRRYCVELDLFDFRTGV